LRHRPATPDARQQAAFEDPVIVDIVDKLLAYRDLRLLKLAHTASLISQPPTEEVLYALITPTLYLDEILGEAAMHVATQAVRIGTEGPHEQRVRRRGALLERLTFKLVESRLPGRTYHEHEVELTNSPRTHRSWSRPKEVVADGPQFEVYECKSGGIPDVGDIDDLSDISSTATAEAADARPTIVVLGSEGNLRIQAKAWRLTERIYGVSTEQILAIAERAPDVAIRPAP
jgi:hypothetical protein